jgi:tRNA dimethylallyltransferase
MKQQLPTELLRQCVFLAGPTGVGKTDVTIDLAREIGPVEVVSLDSMCVYRTMDIGTAKPSAELQAQIPHHLLDLVDTHEDFSVAEYVSAAGDVCAGIVARKATPLFVGGTGLYLRGLLRGVFEGPPADWDIRNRLQQHADDAAARDDNFWLMRQLEKVDPDVVLRLHPNDQRRLIRALEVYELTGIPLSKHQKQPALPEGERPPHVYWLSPPRDWLHERINLRVEQMMAAGLVAEVRRLTQQPGKISRTAAQGLGYKEVIEALGDDADSELSTSQLAETTDLIQTRTRQFAKRQHTMFRNTEECHEIEITESDTAASIAARIATRVHGES